MPVVTYTFTLPDEQSDLTTCQKAGSYRHVLYQVVEFLRNERKHKALSPQAMKFADQAWDEVWRLLNEENITDEF